MHLTGDVEKVINEPNNLTTSENSPPPTIDEALQVATVGSGEVYRSNSVLDEATETENNNVNDDADEEDIRGNWSHHIEFILSCIGYAVGLGNVWRFPYQCYRNGGGCFLVVYWILAALVGFPIVFFEQAIGQYTSQGPMNCWNYAPIVKGIGFSMVALSALACIYYNIIIAWSIFMLFASFRAVLPWVGCDYDSWADFRCELKRTDCTNNGTDVRQQIRSTDGLCYNSSYLTPNARKSATVAQDYFNVYFNFTTCPNSTGTAAEQQQEDATFLSACVNFFSDEAAATFRNTSTVIGYWNEDLAIENDVSPRLSTDEYFHHYVLRFYDWHSTENIGTPSWGLVLCLLLAWILVFLCLLNGIKTSGKVVYFTAIFPYLILFVLIGRGVTLPGALDGIVFYLKPDFEKIKQPEVWFAAANQLFFSISCAWGGLLNIVTCLPLAGMIALSSYNKFQNNVLRDAVITVFADSFTSFIAGFAIFSIIGYGALLLDKPVDKVATAGTGLAFVMYPKILLELPGSVAWSIAFFFMLLLLGLDSEFNTMETVLTAFLDQMPYFRVNLLRKALFLGCLCSAFFLLGIPMVCNGGSILSDVVDEYSSGWGALIVGVIETLSISWLYGSKKFHQDLKLMMGSSWTGCGQYYLIAFWGIISPGIVIFILIYSWVIYTPISTNKTDEAIGWLCAAFVLIWPPVIAVYEIITAKPGGTIWQRIRYTCTPTVEWGPWLVKDRRLVKHLGPNFNIDPRNKLKNKTATVITLIDDSTKKTEKDNAAFEMDSTAIQVDDTKPL